MSTKPTKQQRILAMLRAGNLAGAQTLATEVRIRGPIGWSNSTETVYKLTVRNPKHPAAFGLDLACAYHWLGWRAGDKVTAKLVGDHLELWKR